MRFYCLLATLFLLIASSLNSIPEVLASSVVNFPISGPTSIQAIVRQGDYPHLIFQYRRTGQILLEAQVGSGNLWK
jgi:hypothetical protein